MKAHRTFSYMVDQFLAANHDSLPSALFGAVIVTIVVLCLGKTVRILLR